MFRRHSRKTRCVYCSTGSTFWIDESWWDTESIRWILGCTSHCSLKANYLFSPLPSSSIKMVLGDVVEMESTLTDCLFQWALASSHEWCFFFISWREKVIKVTSGGGFDPLEIRLWYLEQRHTQRITNIHSHSHPLVHKRTAAIFKVLL